jgi:hypothetical protein
MFKLGDRVKILRLRQTKKELLDAYINFPIEVVEVSGQLGVNRPDIKLKYMDV